MAMSVEGVYKISYALTPTSSSTYLNIAQTNAESICCFFTFLSFINIYSQYANYHSK